MPEGLEFKIAIIGAGEVGANLAKVLAAKGHTIIFGVRNPGSDKTRAALADLRDQAVATSIADAITIGDVIVLAVGWPDAGEVVTGIAGQLTGKIVIDTTNRFGEAVQLGHSAAEVLAQIAPAAQWVKCFNAIGAEHYLDPMFEGAPATMLLCGDDEEAKTFVGWLVSDAGFEVVDAGPLSTADMLESLGRLWLHLARSSLGRNFAFRLVKK
jgi:8-hydroxy-5-deazaflavin:NADPH oxidoreductase